MFFYKILLLSSLYIFFINFSKKLISLLSLELMMITLIIIFFYLYSETNMGLFSIFLVFLIMMVLDSVLGISLLVNSCRFSNKMNYLFF